MSKRKTLVVISGSMIASVAIAALCWFAFLPYPFQMYCEARNAVKYSRQWPMSQADYAAARKVVRQQMEFYEGIQKVTPASATRIEFTTLQHWSGGLAWVGQGFVLEKVDGKWTLIETMFFGG